MSDARRMRDYIDSIAVCIATYARCDDAAE